MNAEQYSINRYQQIYTTCCFKLCRSALPRWSQWQQASHGSPHFWYSEASLVTTWNSGNTATRTANFGHILNRHARSYFRKMLHIAPLHKNAQTDVKVLATAYCSSVQDCVATLPIWLAANLVHLHGDLSVIQRPLFEKIWKAKTWTPRAQNLPFRWIWWEGPHQWAVHPRYSRGSTQDALHLQIRTDF